MSLLFLESFDIYSDIAEAELGRWQTTGNVLLSTTHKRTGLQSLQIGGTLLGAQAFAVTALAAETSAIGVAAGFRLTDFPTVNNKLGIQFRDGFSNVLFQVHVQANGSIGFYSGGVLLGNSGPVITRRAWYHIEARLIVDDVVGTIEVLVNGATVLLLTDLDLGTTQIGAIAFAREVLGTPGEFFLDDVVIWDSTGTANNTPVGPVSVITLLPTADTAAADWSIVGTTDGFDAINNIPPNPAEYITSATAGHVSEFVFADTPPEVDGIIGASLIVQAQLDAAGVGTITTGLVSGIAADTATSANLPVGWVYLATMHEIDPNTLAAWTSAGLDAALIRLQKAT